MCASQKDEDRQDGRDKATERNEDAIAAAEECAECPGVDIVEEVAQFACLVRPKIVAVGVEHKTEHAAVGVILADEDGGLGLDQTAIPVPEGRQKRADDEGTQCPHDHRCRPGRCRAGCANMRARCGHAHTSYCPVSVCW